MLSEKHSNSIKNREKGNRKESLSRSRSRSRSHSASKKRSTDSYNDIKNRLKAKASSLKTSDRLDKEKKEEKFVWGKKLEELQKKGIRAEELEEIEKEKQRKLEREIEKVRRKKQEREKDQKVLDKEKVNKQEIINEDDYKKWLDQEEKFHIEQAKLRSEIRIQQGREQPVDYLVKILLIHRGQFDYDPVQEREIKKPYILLSRLTLEELNQLHQDIQEQTKIEVNDYYKQFWDEIKILVEDRIIAFNIATNSKGNRGRSAMGEEFEKEVNDMIGDKSYNELIELEKEIHQTIDCPSDFKIDVEYWENVLKKLRIRKAKAFLEEMGSRFLDIYKQANPNVKKSSVSVLINAGDLSPRLLDFNKSFEKLTISQLEDVEALNEERGNILMRELQKLQAKEKTDKPKKKKDEGDKMEEEEVEAVGDQEDGKEERDFEETAIEETHQYEWAGKHKPRKPQYFNRVKVGYEWNKYNQTHYDQDNPPPKVVLGYKFNIFYPDIVDPTKAPEFHLEPTDNPEFCIVRFQGGPPYEDIAFKILNREWDFSDRQGFKCIFEGNILYLYFNFRKPRYRR